MPKEEKIPNIFKDKAALVTAKARGSTTILAPAKKDADNESTDAIR